MKASERLRGQAMGALGAARRRLTPERVLAFGTLAAAALLAISQFLDYRGVRAGYEAYRSVSDVVAAPIIDGTRASAGSSHLYVLLVAAALAVWALPAALAGRVDRARLIAGAGVAGVAISLVIDLPKGLREGSATVGYADAHAVMLTGFYMQLIASALLILCGGLLIRHFASTGDGA